VNKKSISFSILFLLITFCSVSGQGLLKDIEFSFGYGKIPQDRRLFDYPLQQVVLAREESNYDHQFDFMLNKDLFHEKILNINAAIGYSLYKNKFGRPFDQNYLTGNLQKPLLHIGTYYMHNLKLSVSPEYYFINNEKSKFGIIFPIALNYTFNKDVKLSTGTWSADKWLFDFRNFEIFSGLKYKYRKISLSAVYRIYNIQDIDNLIFYGILFEYPYPSFFYEKSEDLNLNKLIINIGYSF
jgi:hypothetical protein